MSFAENATIAYLTGTGFEQPGCFSAHMLLPTIRTHTPSGGRAGCGEFAACGLDLLKCTGIEHGADAAGAAPREMLAFLTASARMPDPSANTSDSSTPPETAADPPADSAGGGRPDVDAPEQIGDFHLLRRLGQGGMAEVWLAEQTSLKRHVALKLLRRDMTEDRTYVQRFQVEAKAAAGLNHPNIVQVYTVGQQDGQHFIAQEYVQGQTLRTLLQKKGPLGAIPALHIMRQVAAALQAAAERGIVHRDIKPENVMITRRGEVKVADFGLAQQTQGDQLHLTQEGITVGTPLYMSPEQVKGRKLDHRSDLYSLGVTCYHMLAGRPPFQGETAVTVAVQHLNDDPEPLAVIRPDLPRPLCEIVERLMAKQPEDRYPDAKSVLLDVRRILKALKDGDADDAAIDVLSTVGSGQHPVQPPANRRRVLWRTAACLLAAGTAAGLGWWLRTPNLVEVVEASGLSVPRMDTAREQYLHAMFHGNSEQGWLAVRQRFPEETLWRIRATEQLALLYLQDPARKEDARRELQNLRSYRNHGEWYEFEAAVGEAALYAYEGNLLLARQKLPRAGDGEGAGVPWRGLRDEIDQLIDQSTETPDETEAASAGDS